MTKEKDNPLVAVVIRNRFYQSAYRRLLVILAVSFIMNMTLASTYYYLLTHPPLPVYFATTLNGRILPVYPLDQPNRSDKEILEWATNAAKAAFTYNYTNYRREFQASSDFFTPWGWTQFLNALKASNNLDAVIYKKLAVSAEVPSNLPVNINRQGIINGHYAWRVKIPLIITYQSTREFSQQKSEVTLLVLRQSTLNSPGGVGIEQFVVSPR